MHLLVLNVGQYDTGFNDDGHDLDLCVMYVPFEGPYDKEDRAKKLADGSAELVRARYNLTSTHRENISAWLRHASVGDTLLLPKTIGDLKEQPDDIAIVNMGYGNKPDITRMVVRTVVKTEQQIRLDKLPVGNKTIKKGDLKKGKKKT